MDGVALRPLAVGEILDAGVKLTWSHAWTLLKIVLVVVLPVQAVALAIELVTLPGPVEEITSEEALLFPEPVSDAEFWVEFAGFMGAFLLVLFAVGVAIGGCYKAVADAYLGRTPSASSSLRYALRRLHSLVWISLVYWIVVGTALLLVIPGFFLAVAWFVAIPALLTEGVKGFSAAGRSNALVRGRWWPVFAVVLVALAIAVFVGAVEEVVARAPIWVDAEQSPLAVYGMTALGQLLGILIWAPIVAAFSTAVYFDLRVRKEGLDLAVLLERIGVAPDPAREPAPALEADQPWSGAHPPYWPPPPGWQPTPLAPPPPAPWSPPPAPPGYGTPAPGPAPPGSWPPAPSPPAPEPSRSWRPGYGYSPPPPPPQDPADDEPLPPGHWESSPRPPAPQPPPREEPPYWPPPPGWRPGGGDG